MIKTILSQKYLDQSKLNDCVQNWLNDKSHIWKEIMGTNFLYNNGFNIRAIAGSLYISWPRLEVEKKFTAEEIDDFDFVKYKEDLKAELITAYRKEIATIEKIIDKIHKK